MRGLVLVISPSSAMPCANTKQQSCAPEFSLADTEPVARSICNFWFKGMLQTLL